MISSSQTKNNTRGFVILFTVLIASIILAIALGIASVSYREVLLSSTANNAEFSFFAADTGAECALYWDIQQSAFGATLVTPSCGGSAVTMTSSSSPFGFRFATSTDGCASVTIDKSDPTTTKIESLGYNVACNELLTNPTNPRIVERANRVTYGPGQAPAANPNTANNNPQGPSSTTLNTANNNPQGPSSTTLNTANNTSVQGPPQSLGNPPTTPNATLEAPSAADETTAASETEKIEPTSVTTKVQ
jgi:Tfp pilus assembly protein PilE